MNLKVVVPTLSIMGVLLLSTATLTTLAPSSAYAAKIEGSGTCSTSGRKLSVHRYKHISTKNKFEARAIQSKLKKKIVNPGSGATNSQFRNSGNKKYDKNKFTCVTLDKVRSGKNGRGSRLDTYEVFTYYRLTCKEIRSVPGRSRKDCVYNTAGRTESYKF